MFQLDKFSYLIFIFTCVSNVKERSLLIVVVNILAPYTVAPQSLNISKHEKSIFSSSYSHIHSLLISHKTNNFLFVGTYTTNNNYIHLLSLEGVHCTYSHFIKTSNSELEDNILKLLYLRFIWGDYSN
jgi:hypothetical protein